MSARRASSLARGVRGHAPPRKFVRFRRSKISSGAFWAYFPWHSILRLIFFFSEYLYTNSLVLMVEAYVVIQHEQVQAVTAC